LRSEQQDRNLASEANNATRLASRLPSRGQGYAQVLRLLKCYGKLLARLQSAASSRASAKTGSIRKHHLKHARFVSLDESLGRAAFFWVVLEQGNEWWRWP